MHVAGPRSSVRARVLWVFAWVTLLALAAGLGGRGARAWAAPVPSLKVALLGAAEDGWLAHAEHGVRLAGDLPGLPEGDMGALEPRAFDDRGTEAGFTDALKRLKAWDPDAVLALPAGDLTASYAQALRTLRVPCFVLAPGDVDALRGGASTFHLAPSLVAQAVAVGDALRAPLGAASVLVVREPTPRGEAFEAALARNLPSTARHLGTQVLEVGREAEVLAALGTAKEGWVVAALWGRHLTRFVGALEEAGLAPRCVFLDLARDDALRAGAPKAFEASILLGGPDPEGEGRAGEGLLNLLDTQGRGSSEALVRAAEATRRWLTAVRLAASRTPKRVLERMEPPTPQAGLLGKVAFEAPGTVRFFPLRLWRVRKGRLEEVPAGQLPTPDCGPPLGFAPPKGHERPARGRLGYLTFGKPPARTIEADLKVLGLTTGGYDPELDQLVLDEILGRAIRIAYRLFRREADGTPLVGWSWGMALTTARPAATSPSEVWVATLAGDDPEAGGRVTGSGTVAVYTTFLQRTMYAQHRLDPALEAYDKPHLLGRHRWGEDALLDMRGEKIRCLIDGFASAIALTLAHEFGHLCGCGHDTEHPTSIMNVVAGAGASWADAVWIPSHQKNLTMTLGIEGVEK
jgi:hypothetical protein